MNKLVKILLTPVCLIFGFLGGLIVGAFLLIEKPFELAITLLMDVWQTE